MLHLAAQPVRQSYTDPVGTWSTNVQGTLQLLEALRVLKHSCAVVLISSDKAYLNREWEWGYREDDRLGGHDPYSASKAAMELMAASWRDSFCGRAIHQTPHLAIATARAGNVIGGGDWAADRIVPDAMRACAAGKPVRVRNPMATRPGSTCLSRWPVICCWHNACLWSLNAIARRTTSDRRRWPIGRCMNW